MKPKVIFILAVFLLLSDISEAGKLELQISYGRWTLSPFTTIVENESEQLIQKEIQHLMSPSYPENIYFLYSPQVDLGSSGYFLSMAVWYNFENSPFSLGLKGQYFNFRIPFSAYIEQSFTILGQELIRIETQGEGETKLSSIAASVLGRWTFLMQPKFQLSVFGGLNFFPYKGTIFLEGQVLIQSRFGDVLYKQSDNPTLDDVRQWDDQIPSLFVSPEIGLSFQYRVTRKLGLFVDVAISQGASVSLGLFFDQ